MGNYLDDYLGRLKFFFRWLYNYKINKNEEANKIVVEDMEEWETPEFIRIRKKNTKHESPYSEAEIWEQDELLPSDMSHIQEIKLLSQM